PPTGPAPSRPRPRAAHRRTPARRPGPPRPRVRAGPPGPPAPPRTARRRAARRRAPAPGTGSRGDAPGAMRHKSSMALETAAGRQVVAARQELLEGDLGPDDRP